MDLTIKDHSDKEHVFNQTTKLQDNISMKNSQQEPLNLKTNPEISAFRQNLERLQESELQYRLFFKATVRPFITNIKKTFPETVQRDATSDYASDFSDESATKQAASANTTSMVVYKYPKICAHNGSLVQIGPNGTLVDQKYFNQIVWANSATATRGLLKAVFDVDILATHTLTGKPSPAFYGRERPPKNRLDENKVLDLIHCVMARCPGSSVRDIRATITTKCADATKRKRYTIKKTEILMQPDVEMNVYNGNENCDYNSDDAVDICD